MPRVRPKYTYQDWAEYYDMTDLDRSAMINFYGSLISDRTRSVLELACGTGTITIGLANRLLSYGGSRRVVGLDSSSRMLEIAAGKQPDIEWVQGDLRVPPIAGPFDLIICCYNTLHEFVTDDDLAQVFGTIRRLVSREGIFAFDIYQPNLDYLHVDRSDCVVRSVTDGEGRRVEVREDSVYDPATRILHCDWRLVLRDDQNAPPLAYMSYDFRQYFPDEIDSILARAGFVVDRRYGAFDRSPPNETSKKQIIICRPG